MKRFILVSVGFEKPTKEIIDAWMNWFESIKVHVVDSGNPFRQVREVTKDRVKELPHDKNAITGYIIINAKDMDEAVTIAKSCPMITSMRVYEAMSM